MPPDCQRCYQQAERALRLLACHKTQPGNCLAASYKAPYVAQREHDETNDDAVSVVVLHGWLRWSVRRIADRRLPRQQWSALADRWPDATR